jgi:hypothetical protein
MHHNKDTGATTASYRGYAISVNCMGLEGQTWLAHYTVERQGFQLSSVTLDREFATARDALTAAQLEALAFVDAQAPLAPG